MTATCQHCAAVYDGPWCPDCATEHEKASKSLIADGFGKRAPSLTLDQQEGNAEEYFGGFDFAEWGHRR